MKLNKSALLCFALFCQIGSPQAQSLSEGRSRLTFLDSRIFDGKLSSDLKSNKEVVEVEIAGKIPLTNIPARMDRWITTVGENGRVEVKTAEPEMRTRAFFALVPAAFELLQKLSEERMLEPAKNYNAAIIYRKDPSGDSLIEKIIFTRKPDAGS